MFGNQKSFFILFLVNIFQLYFIIFITKILDIKIIFKNIKNMLKIF